MFNRVRSSAIVAVAVATALAFGTVPAGADAPVYSTTPHNGWGHDGTGYAVEIVGDTVYVGGSFTHAVRFNQSELHEYIMAVQRSNGMLNSSFQAWTNGTVRSIVWDRGSYLYIGGDFTVVNGEPRNRFARLHLDGTIDLTFAVNANKPVRDLAVAPDGTIYLVGDFTSIGGQTRKRAAAVNAGGGVLPFNPNLSNKTYAVAVTPGNRVYVGGNFTTVGGQPRSFLAEVDRGTGGLVGGAFNQLNDLVLDLSVTDSQVFAAVDGGMNSAAAWALGGGTRQWRAQAHGDVQAVHYDNGSVYFGFHDSFTIDGVRDFTLRILAADADSGTIESFRPVSGGAVGVWGIDSDGQYLAVVGKFPKMGGFNVKGLSIHLHLP